MKNKLRTLAILVLFLSVVAIPANSKALAFDNTTQFTTNFGIINPCNGEILFGPINIFLVVNVTEAGNGSVHVNVHHTSHGSLPGTKGNVYQISRHAQEHFDAIDSVPPRTYDIPWDGEFIGKGSAPNFSAEGVLRVFVNAQNEPVVSGLVSTSSTCKK